MGEQVNWNWSNVAPKAKERLSKASNNMEIRSSFKTRTKPHMSSALAINKTKSAENSTKSAENVEQYSGLRIKNRLISGDDMTSHMQGREMISLTKLSCQTSKLEDESVDWVTVGVISQKSLSKVSSSGGKYIILTLSDLSNTSISVFLFNEAYESHWRESEGSIVAIINAGIIPSNEKGSFALKIKSTGELAKIGTSEDFGLCQANTNGGGRCKNAVNKSKCEYCLYHVASQFKNAGGRMQLNHSFNTAHSLSQKKAKPLHLSNGTFKTSSKGNAVVGVNTRLSSSGQIVYDFQENKPQNKKTIQSLEKITAEFVKSQKEKKTMTRGMTTIAKFLGVETENKTKSKINMMDFMSKKGKKDVKMSLEPKSESKIDMKVEVPGESKIFSRCLKENVVLPNKPTHFSFIDDQESIQQKAKLQQQAVASLLKKRGISFQEEDQEVMKRRVIPDLKFLTSRKEKTKKNVQQTFLKVFGTNETSNKEEATKLLEQKSSHADDADQVAFSQLDHSLSSLEHKERLAESMKEITEMNVTAYTCIECNYTAQSAAKYCYEKNHQVKRVESVKRWFMCGQCKIRITVIGSKQPLNNCLNCSQYLWSKISMYQERKKTQEEIFKPTGERQINSLRFG